MREPAIATGVVLALTVVCAWMVEQWLLAPFGLDYLRLLALVLIAGTLAQAALVAMKKPRETSSVLGMLSVAVLAVVFLAPPPTLWQATLQGIGAGVAVGIAMILFAALRQRVDAADVPAPFRGAPIAVLTAGFVLLALLGLSGLGAG